MAACRSAHSPSSRRSARGVGLAGLAAALLAGGAGAADISAANRFSGATLGFEIKGTYSNVTLTVTGPDGYLASAYAEKSAPSLDLGGSGKLADGQYHYQLTAADPSVMMKQVQLDNGRDKPAPDSVPASVTMSGVFTIRDGAIIKPVEEKE
ncbi:hypothetical protein DFR52_104403 [Hoeflea marina]|uniref:Secreted protein n=1 Tax=Hoeflea marina TaxID=274592 RepID=A0A317PFY0_9HYPH|nr:hypothetical protein [Hoeflea marina]PWV99111.1 hypothetical protein DFR52_104403 [Hoeflea marina]